MSKTITNMLLFTQLTLLLMHDIHPWTPRISVFAAKLEDPSHQHPDLPGRSSAFAATTLNDEEKASRMHSSVNSPLLAYDCQEPLRVEDVTHAPANPCTQTTTYVIEQRNATYQLMQQEN